MKIADSICDLLKESKAMEEGVRVENCKAQFTNLAISLVKRSLRLRESRSASSTDQVPIIRKFRTLRAVAGREEAH